MFDIHSHILPGIDDGSRDTKESVALLRESARQGVTRLAATSHFYASENSPEEFLRRRKKAALKLKEAWEPEFPKVRLGAEVYFFSGISRTEELDRLKIQGTDLLLLEMPFSAWSSRMVEEVLEIQNRQNITVLLAHIERYMKWQKKDVWEYLRRQGIKIQCNAEFFLDWRTKRRALGMLKRGEIHFLGSDCHNMSSRPPRLGEAAEVIQHSLGPDGWKRFWEGQEPYLEGWSPAQ